MTKDEELEALRAVASHIRGMINHRINRHTEAREDWSFLEDVRQGKLDTAAMYPILEGWRRVQAWRNDKGARLADYNQHRREWKLPPVNKLPDYYEDLP